MYELCPVTLSILQCLCHGQGGEQWLHSIGANCYKGETISILKKYPGCNIL